jgi:hypothetical protein
VGWASAHRKRAGHIRRHPVRRLRRTACAADGWGKLADSLDYLHIQKVKKQQPARLKLAEVKATLALD